jgi:hypothetical protein
MIGDVRYIEGKPYLQVNDHGTLEILPPIPWWRQLYLYLLNYFGKLHLEDVRRKWK